MIEGDVHRHEQQGAPGGLRPATRGDVVPELERAGVGQERSRRRSVADLEAVGVGLLADPVRAQHGVGGCPAGGGVPAEFAASGHGRIS